MSPLLVLLSCAVDPAALPEEGVPGDGGGAIVAPGDAPDAPGDAEAPAEPAFDAVAALTRASLDLRGIRPDEAEIAAVEADPDAYADYVEAFLVDPAFGGRLRALFGEIYLTRQDSWYVGASDYGLSDEVAFSASVGDEPLRILSTIAEQDLPYTDIVTADWTMADEHIGRAWPTDYPDDGEGWMQVRYTDGRPSAGVLSTNGMWWRYTSTDSNANRGRANAISRILLCNDYLSKPIEFDRNVNLLDSDALSDALQNNPGCVACHNTLDPLASYLYGFYHYIYYSRTELTSYHAERESMWRTATGVQPGYYGEVGYDLEDLGQHIAGDPRLPQCVTEQVFELLTRRDAGIADDDTLTAMREVFLDEGLTLRALFREVLLSDAYRLRLDAEGGDARKMISVDQLGDSVEALTGFRFEYQGYDVLHSDDYGVRTLAGGVDGTYSTRPADAPTATSALVLERISQAAAAHAVEADGADPQNARLFTLVDFRETPETDRAAMAAQVQRLHLLLYGRHVAIDGEEVEDNLALWSELHGVLGDPEACWAGLLSVLLRDPDFLFY
jgi:hypothetical protein